MTCHPDAAADVRHYLALTGRDERPELLGLAGVRSADELSAERARWLLEELELEAEA